MATEHDDLVIERRIELDLDAAELWDLVATPEGWRRWLVDGGEVEIRTGGAGRVVDGEVERHVRIGEVDAGRSVTFTWWDHDDPSTASQVTIGVVRHADGAGALEIVERIPALRVIGGVRASATAHASASASVRFAWEVRACVLWAATRSLAAV